MRQQLIASEVARTKAGKESDAALIDASITKLKDCLVDIEASEATHEQQMFRFNQDPNEEAFLAVRLHRVAIQTPCSGAALNGLSLASHGNPHI